MQLIFDDGTIFSGQSFGAKRNVQGEVVFNTAMSGYVETLTDPSYCGQILVCTYPIQGNYGVPSRFFESERIQVRGLIVSTYSEEPHHYLMNQTLGSWLKSQNIPAVFGVDTRSLTRYLREFGTIEAKLLHSDPLKTKPSEIESVIGTEMLTIVSGKDPIYYDNGGKMTVLVIDTGAKRHIIRSLLLRGLNVIQAPWHSPWEEYLDEVHGVMLTNGPGDPMYALDLVERVQALFDRTLPIFGICLGNQILALAAGAKTTKMKYGHRSINQPVRDVFSSKCYITSQNHGYVVDSKSLSNEWEPWFVNVSDGSNEGIRHKTKPFRSVQFHPEARPGPHDTDFLFDEFAKTISKHFKPTAHAKHIKHIKKVIIVGEDEELLAS